MLKDNAFHVAPDTRTLIPAAFEPSSTGLTPPDPPDTAAPFRAPGLPVDAPRWEPLVVRVARAGWTAARAVLSGGVVSLRRAASPRLPVTVEAARAVGGLLRSALRGGLGLGTVSLVVAGVQFALRGWAVGAGYPLSVAALLVVGGALAPVALVAAGVGLTYGIVAAHVVVELVVVAGTVAVSALLVFVGAVVRELGREVTRRAYDARVRRARTQVRSVGDEGGVGADGDAHHPERQGAARRCASTGR